MPNPFKATGGARLGWTNATWPLARLSATPDKLSISVSLLGTYDFVPDQVSAIERYVMIPVLGWGIQVHHRRADYPQRVIFWCLGSPDSILRGIHDSGFLAMAQSSEISEQRGIAVRWSAILFAVVIWNVLFMLDLDRPGEASPHPGPFILLALLSAFALSVGTLKFSRLQSIILKPNRNIGEIRPILRLLAFISGLMLIVFLIIFACGGFIQASNQTPEPAPPSGVGQS